MAAKVFFLLLIATSVVCINKLFDESACEDSGNVCIPPRWCKQGFGLTQCPSYNVQTVCCKPKDVIGGNSKTHRQGVWAVSDANRERCTAAGGKCKLKLHCEPDHIIRRLKCGEKYFCCKQNI